MSSLQSNEVLGTQLVALESEKAELVQSLSKVEAELAVRGEELERVQSSLATERESGVKAAEALQNQLNEKVKNFFRLLHATSVLNFCHWRQRPFKDQFKRACLLRSTGEQGAGAGEPAGSSSLVQSAGSCGGGGEDRPGLAGSD